MKSALYDGHVHHTRQEPEHAFGYRVLLTYVDLDELPGAFRGRLLWSARFPNVVWLRRKDYLGPPEMPLKQAVLDRVESELGRRPVGAVRMLTHLRTLGYVFNPVTFYYCFDAEDRLEAVVAEITNTPWKERHAYVLDARSARRDSSGAYCWKFGKSFHVSPFFDMDHVYEWVFTPPGDEVGVGMTNFQEGRPVFHAGLSLRRRPLGSWNLARLLPALVFRTMRVHAAIYWQAFRLWRKRAPFFVHPDKRPPHSEGALEGPTT